jgi:hypothetical protein
MLPVTDQRKKKPMNNTAPYDHMPAGYAEDRPFRMSETASLALTEMEERTGSLPLITHDAERFHFPRNSFFSGICLALPLSALLWLLIIYVL